MAHPSPQPQPDPEKHRDRIITWRAALLSAVVVLMAGVVGATSSYIVADKQIQSQAQQSRDDFLREQRQAQYAKLIADANRLSARLSAEPQIVVSPALPQEEALTMAVYDDWVTFDNESAQVQLLAGDEVRKRLRDLREYLYNDVSDILDR